MEYRQYSRQYDIVPILALIVEIEDISVPSRRGVFH